MLHVTPRQGNAAKAADRETITVGLGPHQYHRPDRAAARDAGRTLHGRAPGLASIGPDGAPERARATLAAVEVLGRRQASPEVKAASAGRLR